jgi:hypothetical protein
LVLFEAERPTCQIRVQSPAYRDQYQELTGTSLTECPACQRGRMVIIEVLKPAKPCRPIYDTS